MSRLFDAPRSLLVLLAASIALLGAAGATLDQGFAGWQAAMWVLGIDAIVAAGLAMVPGMPRWSDRRRAVAIWFALGSFLVGGSMELFVGSRAACACGDPASGYVLVTILWMPAQTWTALGLVLAPVLIGAAAIVGSRDPSHGDDPTKG